MVKEIAIGVLGAVSIFMLVMGYDITPLLVLGGLGLVLYYASERAGVGRVVVPGGGGPLTPEITFDDIGGQRTAKQELKEALDFIIRSDEVEKLRIRPLKGILLTGPPGTGKTLLAKAAAAYTDALFIAASGSEFIEMYAGVGAQRIRSLFRRARGLAQRLHKNRAVVF
ncbi:MAG: AAA family ATPase, partial [Clostridia bacterium]|nr:AAA family ATPase [Clostridia bacterium]